MEVTICPKCGSEKIKKNGHIHSGKQNHQCQQCGRQFVAESEQKLISAETRNLLKKLLLERVSLRGICRAIGISLRWLLLFIVNLYGELPEDLNFERAIPGLDFEYNYMSNNHLYLSKITN